MVFADFGKETIRQAAAEKGTGEADGVSARLNNPPFASRSCFSHRESATGRIPTYKFDTTPRQRDVAVLAADVPSFSGLQHLLFVVHLCAGNFCKAVVWIGDDSERDLKRSQPCGSRQGRGM